MVLLDTNALMLPFTRRFPLEAEIERVVGTAQIQVPAFVVAELEALVARRVRGAQPALEWSRKFPRRTTHGRGDDALVRTARPRRDWVVTSDRELQRRLTAAGVSTLIPRDRQRLEPIRGELPSSRRRRSRSSAATVKNGAPVVPLSQGARAKE
ncbi:MAG: PIN domain-containing protein [Thermoplasmata archaeon]